MIVKAAGILLLNKEGKALFLLRGLGGDMPGMWCIPGGRLEDGEDAATAAARETEEEAGFKTNPKKLTYLARQRSAEAGIVPPTPVDGIVPDSVDFTTFVLRGVEEFIPTPSDEHVAYAWAPVDQPPMPLHPGVNIALRKVGGQMNELHVAEAIRDGQLTSPQIYGNMSLFAIRITGTGMAYRSERKDAKGKVTQAEEFVWRRPENYLTDEFLRRCNGLPVIVMHPDKIIMSGNDFAERIAGTIFLPYIKADEVWGIAKILDPTAAVTLTNEQMSTSPGVLLGDTDFTISTDDGTNLLIEGPASLVDHLAICPQGVWDKLGKPAGIQTTANARGDSMKIELARINGETDAGYAIRVAEAEKFVAAARGDSQPKPGEPTLADVLAGITTLGGRFDELKGRQDSIDDMMKSKKDADDKDEAEKKKGDARKRADAFTFSKRGDSESEDDMKARHDAEEKELAETMKAAGDDDDKAKGDAKKRRGDAESSDEVERKAKADAAAAAGHPLQKSVDGLQKRLDELTASMPRLLTDADRTAFSGAQARADAAYQAFGKSAPAPMQHEELGAYRVRLLEGLKEHSPTWKDNTFAAARADSHTLGIAEGEIFAAAIKASRNPARVPVGQLFERKSRSEAGHQITDFDGENITWMAQFMPTAAYAKLTPPTRH